MGRGMWHLLQPLASHWTGCFFPMFLLPSLKDRMKKREWGLVEPAWEQGDSRGGLRAGTSEELHLRAGTSGIRHHCPAVTGVEFCDHLGMAVVPKVTLIWLRALPSPWVLEPTQGKGSLLTPYSLSLPAYHSSPGERERRWLWWSLPSLPSPWLPVPETGPWRDEREPSGARVPLRSAGSAPSGPPTLLATGDASGLLLPLNVCQGAENVMGVEPRPPDSPFPPNTVPGKAHSEQP